MRGEHLLCQPSQYCIATGGLKGGGKKTGANPKDYWEFLDKKQQSSSTLSLVGLNGFKTASKVREAGGVKVGEGEKEQDGGIRYTPALTMIVRK